MDLPIRYILIDGYDPPLDHAVFLSSQVTKWFSSLWTVPGFCLTLNVVFRPSTFFLPRLLASPWVLGYLLPFILSKAMNHPDVEHVHNSKQFLHWCRFFTMSPLDGKGFCDCFFCWSTWSFDTGIVTALISISVVSLLRLISKAISLVCLSKGISFNQWYLTVAYSPNTFGCISLCHCSWYRLIPVSHSAYFVLLSASKNVGSL